MSLRRLALGGGLLGVAAVSAGLWVSTSGGGAPAAALSPHNGRFHVECAYSHSAPDDPIVHPGEPGASHQHDFFGATSADAYSDAESLAAGETTCRTRQDTAGYWAPSLFDGDRQIEPISSTAYYRAAPGVTPADVEPFPMGLVMIGGDPSSTETQSTEQVGWACTVEALPRESPPGCQSSLILQVVFPDCWDGEHLDSVDHRSHVSRSTAEGCPGSHPVALPQLEFHVQYPAPARIDDLRLASGSVFTGHADFFNAWEPEKLAEEIEYCIGQDAYC